MPGLRVDRAEAALIGAVLMVGCGVLSLEDAYRALDRNPAPYIIAVALASNVGSTATINCSPPPDNDCESVLL